MKTRAKAVEERRDFAFEYDICFVCVNEWKKPSRWPYVLDIHEIARGPARRRAYRDRRAWLRLCRRCHKEVGDLSKWPVAAQLAVKKIRDPLWYDRRAVNRMRGLAPDAITEEQVNEQVQRLTAGFEGRTWGPPQPLATAQHAGSRSADET